MSRAGDCSDFSVPGELPATADEFPCRTSRLLSAVTSRGLASEAIQTFVARS